MGKDSLNTNDVLSLNPQCQVLWFPWENSDEALSNASLTEVDVEKLSKANAWDISDHLTSCSFSKHLGDPAGTFTLVLDSTKDWKDAIKPGHWIIILMSQDGDLFPSSKNSKEDSLSDVNDSGNPQSFKKAPNPDSIVRTKIRGVCRVDRVSTSINTGAQGEFTASYSITGRDFGCVYQDTELWYNIFLNETNTLEVFNSYINGIQQDQVTASLKSLIKFIHDLTLSDSSALQPVISKFKENLSLPTQWVLPKPLLIYLNQMPASGAPYYGDIEDLLKLDFTPFSMPVVNPILYVQGKLWQRLKNYSAEQLHELFTETDSDGKMHLYYRLIPWAIDTKGYPDFAKAVKSYSDLASNSATSVSLTPLELIYMDLGEDDHSRYNHFLLNATPYFTQGTSSIVQLSNPSKQGRKFPLVNAPDVSRNGFRPMHIDLETFFIEFTAGRTSTDKKNNPISTDYLLQANELSFDYFSKYVDFESGSLTIFGKNDTKVGKVLKLDETFPYNPNTYYYIEGYEDTFTIGAKGEATWIQHIYVTHGVEASKLTNGGNDQRFSKKDRIFNKESSFTKKS